MDIWALGVLLYLLCFGRLPFEGEAKLQVRLELPAGWLAAGLAGLLLGWLAACCWPAGCSRMCTTVNNLVAAHGCVQINMLCCASCGALGTHAPCCPWLPCRC